MQSRTEKREHEAVLQEKGWGWYSALLHRFLVRSIAKPNRADLEDLVQETYHRFLRTDPSAIRHPAAYLCQIATNVLRDWGNRRDKLPVTFNSTLAEAAAEGWADRAADLCEQLLSQEQLEAILEQVQPALRRVLILVECDGMTIEQVATEVGVSVETAEAYLIRARVAVRKAQW